MAKRVKKRGWMVWMITCRWCGQKIITVAREDERPVSFTCTPCLNAIRGFKVLDGVSDERTGFSNE